MKNEKEYENFFAMSRNLFFLLHALSPRRKTSQREGRSNFFSACGEMNYSDLRVFLAFGSLATSITG